MRADEARSSRWLATLMDPALGWLFAFFLLPLAVMLVISFARRGTYGGVEWIYSLNNYVRAMSPDYLTIYARTLAMAGATTVLCLLMAYPAAYYIAVKADPKWRNFYLLLAVVPFWTSFLIRTYAWILLLRTEGLVNTLLVGMGLVSEPLKLLYCDSAVLMGLVYGELPFMILPLYTTLAKLDTGLLEAAEDLGASPAQAFWTVTLPLTLPGIIVGTVFVFIPSLGAFVTPDLLGGSKSIMIGNRVQDLFASVRDQPFGAAISFLLTLIVLAMLFVSMRVKKATEAME
ncbi:MAG: ABC transporter permease [Candidatus Wallbacteria bacterium]|nr:ABC transporter permease [Candidatus Wallbacteria bacterium]